MLNKRLHVLAIFMTPTALIALAAVPTLSQGDGRGGGQQGGGLLGCQQNNPGGLDCSSLEVTGVCEANEVLFTIRNT